MEHRRLKLKLELQGTQSECGKCGKVRSQEHRGRKKNVSYNWLRGHLKGLFTKSFLNFAHSSIFRKDDKSRTT